MDSAATLRGILDEFIGKKCWRVAASPSTGSRVNLDIGPEMEVKVGVRKEVRRFGKYGIQIESGAWRLSHDHRILASSADSPEKDGVLISGLSVLQGCVISDIRIHHVVYDLEVHFEGGYVLSVLCNEANEEGGANYTISVGRTYYSVECRDRRIAVVLRPCDTKGNPPQVDF